MFDVVVDFDVVVGEVAALTDDALVERFRELERSARRHEAELAVVVAELEGRSVYRARRTCVDAGLVEGDGSVVEPGVSASFADGAAGGG